MKRLGVFFTCFKERSAVEFSLQELYKIYPDIPVYLVSEGIDFSYLEKLYPHLHCEQVEDTMSATFKISNINFREDQHQKTMKKCALAVINRLQQAIVYCQSEYILMMDPDALIRGLLNIPNGVKLLGSRVNTGFPTGLRQVLSEIPNAKVINCWGATPAIFHVETFKKAVSFLELNMIIFDRFCQNFHAIYAHDVLLPLLFALVGEEETFNPDIIECNRDLGWESKPNPLVHQFKRYYPS